MLCEICDQLSVEKLVGLFIDSDAKRTAPYYRLPDGAWLPHHSSYKNLVASAKNGCEFCNEIWASCKLSRHHYRQGDGAKTRDYDSVEKVLQSLEPEDVSGNTQLEVCITSSRIASVESKRRMDTLVVRVGRFDLVVEFKLTCPREENLRFGGYRIGRYDISPDLGSDASFNVAKSWLSTCQEQHQETCVPIQPTTLPDRVLDVGNSKVSKDLQLLETSGTQGVYLTLSHSWGDPAGVLQTTTQNLSQMIKHIEFTTMPNTFQDAVTITRKLGYRYLWIDSLCILQDSRTDWETASVKMGDIYKDSALTIAAAVSTGSNGNLIHVYEQPPVPILHNSLKLNASGDSHRPVSIRRKEKYEDELIDGIVKSHLATRGWALQERYLSERILYYGKRQLYWECRGLLCAADGDEPDKYNENQFWRWHNRPQDIQKLTPNSTAAGITPSKYMEFCSTWYSILEQYSKRNLTVASDKLPAISGVAAQFAHLTGDKYVAGLWERDLRVGLLWRCEEPKNSRRPREFRAPTWSWAALDAEISLGYSERNVGGTLHDAEIVGWDMKMAGRDPFGGVESGHITLNGYSWPLLKIDGDISKADIEHDVYFGHPIFDVASEGNSGDMADAYFDTANQRFICGWKETKADEIVEIRPESLTLFLVRMIVAIGYTGERIPDPEETDTPHFNRHAHYGALILRAASGDMPLYERVGYLSMYCTLSRYEKAWTKSTVTIV
ncbi:hypothetical protein VE01_03904 [Pseudogymnoascus verrucosus]|uniref:Heterokaryon incompatibility domain-containing protein n=1 Tax=Pseudogymnoascus verrucosus TaxID=342668 RepID=A0A1B8GQG7_9PEZI|nr:uncharacterized protein VE01_03904 [Pseudogymnoascus verrucosus]OBT98050.2 hypothetical protein VE01_03904 [Pseudogymnoascus verrucosus]